MANNFQLSKAAANAMLGSGSYTLLQLLNGAAVHVSSAAQPANGSTAPAGGSDLCVITLAASGNTIANGVLTLAAASANATAGGTAVCFNIVSSAGTGSVQIGNGTIGTSGCDWNLGTTTIISGALITINAGSTLTLPST